MLITLYMGSHVQNNIIWSLKKNKHLTKQINLHNEDITQRYWMKPNVDKNYSKFETLTL